MIKLAAESGPHGLNVSDVIAYQCGVSFTLCVCVCGGGGGAELVNSHNELLTHNHLLPSCSSDDISEHQSRFFLIGPSCPTLPAACAGAGGSYIVTISIFR